MEIGSNSERKPLVRWVLRSYMLDVKDKDGKVHAVTKHGNILQFWNGYEYEDVALFSEEGVCMNENVLIGELNW